MKSPDFWWSRQIGPLAWLLQPLGMVYGAATLARMKKPGTRVDVPVICIGNMIAGGAGKTPTAIALGEALIRAGERPVFLSRGYGGTARAATVVDLARHSPADVGDEPLLLARVAPVVVAPDRVAGAKLAVAQGASVLIMDDGLQNPALTKDFTLAVIDGGVGHGNGLCVPAGPLRAPAQPQAEQVDGLLVIGLGTGITDAVALGGAAQKPVYRANLTVDAATADKIGGQRVLAFAGIGRPQKFFETLLSLYAKIEGAHAFADHHSYSDKEAADLLAAARARNLLPVTTEKDLVRLKGSAAKDALAAASFALPVRLALPDELIEAVLIAVRRARGPG